MTELAQQLDSYTQTTGRWWDLDTVPEVAQAVGVIATQLGVPDQQAALLLRAHSATHDQDPADTADELLRGRWRFAS